MQFLLVFKKNVFNRFEHAYYLFLPLDVTALLPVSPSHLSI